MKKSGILICIFFLVTLHFGNSSCSHQTTNKLQITTSNVTINIDTIYVNTDGILGNSIKIKDKYYTIFRIFDRNSTLNKDKLIILDTKGKILHQMDVPEDIKNTYNYSLKIHNDSLIAYIKFYNKMIYFNEDSLKWQNIKTLDLPFYEDKEYIVTVNDMGEFGSTVFFKNKRTGLKYEGFSHPLVINKYHNQYYITNYLPHDYGFCSIVKINDPQQMKVSTKDEKSFDFKNCSRKGMEKLLDTTGFYIPVSFIHRDKLFHLHSDRNNTYIATFINKKLTNIFTLPGYTNITYQQKLPDQSQFATFVTDNEKIQGFIETTPQAINIRYVITNGNSGYDYNEESLFF